MYNYSFFWCFAFAPTLDPISFLLKNLSFINLFNDCLLFLFLWWRCLWLLLYTFYVLVVGIASTPLLAKLCASAGARLSFFPASFGDRWHFQLIILMQHWSRFVLVKWPDEWFWLGLLHEWLLLREHHWRHISWSRCERLVGVMLRNPALALCDTWSRGLISHSTVIHVVLLTHPLCLVKGIQLLGLWSKSDLLIIWWSDKWLRQVSVD